MIKEIKKYQTKKWEVSLLQVSGRKYKVTRRLPELSVAETKIFSSRKKTERQFEEWLE
jgi:hypothetical protein